MAFGGIFGGFRPAFDAGGVTPWYLQGGVAKANCVAAYQPKGAASLAASYVNLVNPGTHNAFSGTAPAFDATNGWKFVLTLSQYLKTGITPASNWSAIVRFSNAKIDAANQALLGSTATNASFELAHRAFGTNFRRYFNGANSNSPGVAIASGVMCVAAGNCYLNGATDGTLTYSWTGTGIELYIGARNNPGTENYSTAYIQAVAIYNIAITAGQVAAISTAMAAL